MSMELTLRASFLCLIASNPEILGAGPMFEKLC